MPPAVYWAMAKRAPDSRGHSWPASSPLPRRPSAIARRYSARSACDSRGQGPWSKAWRAASTARAMSASRASGTLKYSCSVDESMTLMTSEEEGSTHSPPMKKRSSWRIGTAVLVMARAPRGCLRSVAEIRGVFRRRCRSPVSGPGRSGRTHVAGPTHQAHRRRRPAPPMARALTRSRRADPDRIADVLDVRERSGGAAGRSPATPGIVERVSDRIPCIRQRARGDDHDAGIADRPGAVLLRRF